MGYDWDQEEILATRLLRVAPAVGPLDRKRLMAKYAGKKDLRIQKAIHELLTLTDRELLKLISELPPPNAP